MLEDIVDLSQNPLVEVGFRERCRRTLDAHGVLSLPGFLKAGALAAIRDDGERCRDRAYYTRDTHNIYLAPPDPAYPEHHPRNRPVSSSKGCITTDQIPPGSALHGLYAASDFQAFLCAVLGEAELHPYDDPLSSINLHYASEGQELGWHFDNSSFAITLLIQAPEEGGVFEYVSDVRDADGGEMAYDRAGEVLDGAIPATSVAIAPGSLVLFRGRNAMHRVTPVIGARTRMLVVLAYNTEPGIALSESARLTFYGRLG